MDSDNSDVESSQSTEEVDWLEKLRRIKKNDPNTTWLGAESAIDDDVIEEMTDEGWEELGRDISNNTHLSNVDLGGNINDHRMSCLFQGLTRSSSMKDIQLYDNGLSLAGLRSMIPFLQNANNLSYLDLDDNNLQSAGFNELFRALSDTPIKTLHINSCSIEAIEIDSEHLPQNLTTLQFDGNNINSDGCREIAKLLKGGNATLQSLSLHNNKIDDEGVGILVDALKNNTSLKTLYLNRNDDISERGLIMILKLVNDISSFNATLQSNHTLQSIYVGGGNEDYMTADHIRLHIDDAGRINFKFINNPDRVGIEKIIRTQLSSVTRESLADIQGVRSSLYSEIDPLHLPEVLALVCHRHGQGELFVALKTSIAGVISTVNRRECVKQQWEYHLTKAKQLEAELAAMDEAERKIEGIESRSSKRRRQ